MRHIDIATELHELAIEISDLIRQQASYYQASVYKTEAVSQLSILVDNLKAIVSLIPDPELQEPFSDFRAISASTEENIAVRAIRLVQGVEALLESGIYRRNVAKRRSQRHYYAYVKEYKDEIVSCCPLGSGRRKFFKFL